MNVKTVFLWVITIIALGAVAAIVSNGPIRLVAIIGILIISFVLQGTIIRNKK
ncbi:MAG TPA: hypothetical protein VE710_25355 [Candidatus Bathyarchaeia archaeon]|nr:hypothetical protein [Candidatus Bathyarchaeia archaeon]